MFKTATYQSLIRICASCADRLDIALIDIHYKQRRMVTSGGIHDKCFVRLTSPKLDETLITNIVPNHNATSAIQVLTLFLFIPNDKCED